MPLKLYRRHLAIAVPAYAGIPVTQRVSFQFSCNRGARGKRRRRGSRRLALIAQMDGTIVFLMGMKNLPRIVSQLISNGRDPETPVAIVRWGTMPEQEVLVSTLAGVVDEVRKRSFGRRAVTIIGTVVALRDLINWAETRPLFGVRIAITRPSEESRKLGKELSRAGADVLFHSDNSPR